MSAASVAGLVEAGNGGAFAVAVVCAVLAMASLAIILCLRLRDRAKAKSELQKIEQLRQQNMRYGVALNNMSQGLVLFDASERVVFSNHRYLEIANLPAEFGQPGRTLRDILIERKARGTFSEDADSYRARLHAALARDEVTSLIITSADGRSLRVANVPMAGGGWIATHEDITDQVTAKRVIESQKQRLDAAVTNMPQGLVMFDREKRLIVCNRQYAAIYALKDDLIRPGTPLRAILEHWASVGLPAKDRKAYVEDRLRKASLGEHYQIINRLPDGRYISVVHRPMAEGGWVATHDDVTEAKRREESFRMLFDSSPMPMWVMDRTTLKFLAVNEAVIARYGFSREQFMSMTVPDLRPPECREMFAAHLRALPEVQLEARIGKHCKADGSEMDVEIYSRALTYEGYAARLTVIHDITLAKLASDELSRTKKFLDAVIENVPVPILVRDLTGQNADVRNARFHLFNKAYETLTGDSREDLIGKTADDIYMPDIADLVVNADIEALATGLVVDVPEHAIRTADKGPRLVTGKKTVIRRDGKPEYLLTVLDDVTDRRRAEERIAYLAHNDSLTELPNRATYVEYLDATLRSAAEEKREFAILCVDLDRFKEANDIYGHLIGDELLRQAARRLYDAADGQFVARVGGDEFTIIVTNGSQPDGAIALSERLLDAFKPYFEIEGQRVRLGLSIGGAVYPADGDNAKALIANADAALYQAKSEARGSLCLFDTQLADRLNERRELQKDLESALVRGEFVLHYQPQETLKTGETTGFEALVRWQCPKRGMVPPGKFISIAEETGLIVSLGTWILREACREAASWPKPLTIAVNISPIQFHAGDLANQVHLILLETGLPAHRLELEITEGVLIDDFGRAVSILRKLKALGVQIAMDDFGSGYSSLSYLHSFAFDKIKIDRSFIGDLDSNHHSMAIVRAIIMLGHSLDVPVLAEGVESNVQRRLLMHENCDSVQGYLLGRPMPITAYSALVGRAIEEQPAYATKA
jgi:diguanylate cyclase (GGDEF)-like protein/PAS domain S-box-containing protein